MCDSNFERWVAKFYLNKHKNAFSRGIEFSINLISLRNVLKAKRCYWTGIELTHPPLTNSGEYPPGYKKRPSDVTIERIDSRKGYVKGNVVACSQYANSLKSVFENDQNDYQPKHFYKMADKMRRAGL